MSTNEEPNQVPVTGDCYESSSKHAIGLQQVKEEVEIANGSSRIVVLLGGCPTVPDIVFGPLRRAFKMPVHPLHSDTCPPRPTSSEGERDELRGIGDNDAE